MRIGLVVPGFSAEPADWCIPALRDLVRELATTDHVRVLTLRYPYAAGRYEIDGADVIALGAGQRRGTATLELWRQALSVLRVEHRRQPFDVLHAFWATESGFLCAIAGRLLRIPTLVSVAGGELVGLREIGYGDQLVPIERLKIRTSLRLASAVSAGSCQLLEQVRRRTPVQAVYLPLGVDTRMFGSASAPTEAAADRADADSPRQRGTRSTLGAGETQRLLHVGALTPVKDQRLLLQAFARLLTQVPTARLDIVGDGPLRPELEQLAAQLGVRDAVCFRGSIDHAALPAVYASADAFVLSSRHEAQCMVALEAAACARPIVGTSVGIIPQLAAAGAALTSPVGDLTALADAMQSALSDTQIAPRAHELVNRDFALPNCTARFRATYAALDA